MDRARPVAPALSGGTRLGERIGVDPAAQHEAVGDELQRLGVHMAQAGLKQV